MTIVISISVICTREMNICSVFVGTKVVVRNTQCQTLYIFHLNRRLGKPNDTNTTLQSLELCKTVWCKGNIMSIFDSRGVSC